MSSSTTRLDKLFGLLEGGDSTQIRSEAANQIAAVAKVFPQQLPAIIRQVHKIQYSKQWEARTAAGVCFGLIAKHVQHHTPADLLLKAAQSQPGLISQSASSEGAKEDVSGLEAFRLDRVLEQGTILLQSGGQEYDMINEGLTAAERLKRQRTALKSRLGMGGHMDKVLDTSDIVADQDLEACASPSAPSQGGKQEATKLLSQMTGLSARERNQMKRKLKQADKVGKRVKAEKPKLPRAEDIAKGIWPFQRLADQLLVDCLNPAWETRHGAAIALRELLRFHAASAAVAAPLAEGPSGWSAGGGHGKMRLALCTSEAALKSVQDNRGWIEDCIVHLLCVLALDRFGDYVSDQVVAPVRETAAQALGAAARPLPAAQAIQIVQLLCQLTSSPDWAVRHGGLLGLKYVLAAKQELASQLLPIALPAALTSLQDADDDVRAVAAEALLPVASVIVQGDQDVLVRLRNILWDILLTLEDLSLSTGSVMQLLALLYKPGSVEDNSDRLTVLVPRLWPFFRHTLTSVRLAAVRCTSSLLAISNTAAGWLTPSVLGSGMQLTFQNFVLETNEDVLLTSQFLQKAAPETLVQAMSAVAVARLFDLGATAEGEAVNEEKLLKPMLPTTAAQPAGSPALGTLVVGHEEGHDAVRMRCTAAEALGLLGSSWKADHDCPVSNGIRHHLDSQAASGRQLAALVSMYWAKEHKSNSLAKQGSLPLPAGTRTAILAALAQPKADRTSEGILRRYSELGALYTQLHQAAVRLLNLCQARRVDVNGLLKGMSVEQYASMLTAENVKELGTVFPGDHLPDVLEAKTEMANTAEMVIDAENALHSSVNAMLAAAIVQTGQLPPKLNSIIHPLIGALRRESSALLRSASAVAVAELVYQCSGRTSSPNSKLVANIAAMVYGNEADNLRAEVPDSQGIGDRENAGKKRARNAGAYTTVVAEEVAAKAEQIPRLGGEAALQTIVHRFGRQLMTGVPKLLDLISSGLAVDGDKDVAVDAQAALESLQVLRVVGPVMHSALRTQVLHWLLMAGACFRHDCSAVRSLAAKAAAAVASSCPASYLPHLLRMVVPMLASNESETGRQGAAALVYELVEQLKERLVPYVFLMVVPLMGRISDQAYSVRTAATSSFASMIALLPLAQGLQPPEELDAEQRESWTTHAEFLKQLLDISQAAPYQLPMSIAGELRPYQQEGINWLAFLQRCGLHGVLADDMGLGKTLQATAIVAASHVEARSTGRSSRPSIIICPQVLVGHWPFEMAKFVGTDVLKAVTYEGPPLQRLGLRSLVQAADVMVTSYETLRADIDWVENIAWNYCILDEGHIIRNPKTKIAQAVKRVTAQHRLILSGTPIQNNIQELWALFDFLMPGFLGSEAAFNAKFGRALQAARSSKKGSKEAQAGLLAVEGLHKQVKPFILRRTKDSVLSDLPPKILQDVYCELSPLQAALYNDFSRSMASQELQATIAASAESQSIETASNKAPHVFQALQYLRKLCSHPLMVLQPTLASHVTAACTATGATCWKDAQDALHELQHAPKLAALQQLLHECNIGIKGELEAAPTEQDSAIGTHRVLVFAQFKGLLDIVERDVIGPMDIPHLRLDGSVEASQRFGIVQRFNQDPSIPVMLLTTGIGGLGLNLTSADTVIFLEHDWNPMKDLQAMDRAHRLGQTRSVNVYRLLMRNSLEERIMSLQRFKVDIANAVINQDNVSLSQMDTGVLLDLLGHSGTSAKPGADESALANRVVPQGGMQRRKTGGLKTVLEGVEDLWDESQYAEEFSLEGFFNKLT